MKTMGLYGNVERIVADLASVGIDVNAPLTVADLVPFDQYHYHGAAAVDDAAAALQLGPGQRVLDVGAGLGGPARYLANQTGASVTALELQPDLDAVARDLTLRCGLGAQVSHVEGNILEIDVAAGHLGASFDAMMSMLCILHIPDRSRLFEQCAASLVPGARVFIEDFYERGRFSIDEQALLGHEVSCPYLPTLDAYVGHLEAAGFTDVEAIDMTEDWTDYVHQRHLGFRASQAELVDRYNLDTFAALDRFYDAVASLFAGGNLGGVRLTAVRA